MVQELKKHLLLSSNSYIVKLTKLFLLISLLSINKFTFGQTMNCSVFKNGTFTIKDSVVGNTFISRYENKQSEKLSGRKDTTTYFVSWLDNCTYTLRPTEATFKIYPFLPKDALLTVKIIEVKENSYVQISSSNFYDSSVTLLHILLVIDLLGKCMLRLTLNVMKTVGFYRFTILNNAQVIK